MATVWALGLSLADLLEQEAVTWLHQGNHKETKAAKVWVESLSRVPGVTVRKHNAVRKLHCGCVWRLVL